MKIRDNVRAGEYYSADYLRVTELDASASFQTMYRLIRCKYKTVEDAGVISLLSEFGQPDNSAVFRVQSITPCIRFGSWEFETSQTGTVLIPAPGDKKRIVVKYGSIRSKSVSGEAWFHDGSVVAHKVYFTNFSSFSAGELYIPMDEGQSLKLTSTQGAKKIYAALNYYIEDMI